MYSDFSCKITQTKYEKSFRRTSIYNIIHFMPPHLLIKFNIFSFYFFCGYQNCQFNICFLLVMFNLIRFVNLYKKRISIFITFNTYQSTSCNRNHREREQYITNCNCFVHVVNQTWKKANTILDCFHFEQNNT